MRRFPFLLALIALSSFLGCGEITAPSVSPPPTPPVPAARKLNFDLASAAGAKTTLESHEEKTGSAAGSRADRNLLGKPLPDRMAAATGTEPLKLFGPTYAGKEFYWSDYRGRVVMVVFWASWCPGCKSLLPRLESLSSFVRNRDFEIVGVNIDEKPSAGRAFLKSIRFPFETIMDGEQNMDLSQEYPTSYVPTIVIVNKAGNITKLNLRDQTFMAELKKLLATPYSGTRPKIRNAVKKTVNTAATETDAAEADEEGLVEAKSGVGAKGRGYGEDPLTYALKARWTTEQKLIFDVQIPKAMSLYQATNDHLPESHEVFMKEIIQASGIHLPKLPAGDKYVYSPSQGKLMVRPAK